MALCLQASMDALVFGGQQLFQGFADISLKLHGVYRGSNALRSRDHDNGRDAGGNSL